MENLLSLPLLISLLVPLLLLLRYVLRSQTRQKLPPSPPKLPIIGHLHLLSDMPHHSLSQLARQLGPIIHLQLGRVPTLVVSSPRLARDILKTHDHSFASRPQLLAAQYLSFGCSDVTFSPYGPYWRQVRKICVTELLSPKRVNSFRLVRDEEVTRLLRSVSVSAVSASETDMSERFFGLANDILCRVAFGRRFSDGSDKNQLNEILTETQALLAGFSVADFFPGLEWVNGLTGLKGRLERNLKDLRTVCDEIIGEHLSGRSGSDDVSGREDFVDVLLRVQKSGDLEVPITDDNLKALVLDMFVAGTDTTSATLEWAMTELARHPRVLEKAQEEVRRIAGAKGKVEEDDLVNLPYMRAVIKETLRLHPPVPLLVPRESIEKCVLDIYEIPAQTRILINTYAIGRDPETWDKPLEYNPERFVGSDIDIKGQDFELLPFGGGRRGCPGYTFGLASIELSLARLLFHFNWALPHGISADDVDLGEIFAEMDSRGNPRRNSESSVHPVVVDSSEAMESGVGERRSQEVRAFRRWSPWLVPLFVVANVLVFSVTMYINNCPKNSSSCVGRFLGRLSFQPFKENPLLGPSSLTLEKMGALEVNKVVNKHQGWRLITCIWLHAGVFHLLANMLSLLFIGIRLEQEFGFVRIGMLYIISGFGGSLLSALFIKASISVGASGALFGLLGGMLSELITNWTIYANKFAALFTLVFIIVINLAVGILPHVDNFAHIGGFISGFLLGFVVLIRPQFEWVNRKFVRQGYDSLPAKPKHKIYQYILWVLALILVIVGFTVGLVMLFRGVNANDHCSWCHYLSCIPINGRSCKAESVYCLSSQSDNHLNLTCSSSGRQATYPLSNVSGAKILELCTQLCS